MNSLLTLDTTYSTRRAAILVYAMPDDYKTQPSGHAGDRIACGVNKPD